VHNELIGVKSSRDAGLVFQVADVIESKYHEELMLNTLVAFGITGDMLSLSLLVENRLLKNGNSVLSKVQEMMGMVVTSHNIPVLKAQYSC
jgi:hypothetical protein